MKRLIFLTLVAVSIFSTSCTKEYVTNVVGGNADMRTVDFNVLTNQWVEYGTPGEQGYGFAVDLNFPEITNNVIQNGMVTLYMNNVLVPPVNYEGGFFYSIQQGLFSIDYYESDHYTLNPGDQTFRLVI